MNLLEEVTSENMIKLTKDANNEELKAERYYCTTCKSFINGVEVTFDEKCDYCGNAL